MVSVFSYVRFVHEKGKKINVKSSIASLISIPRTSRGFQASMVASTSENLRIRR